MKARHLETVADEGRRLELEERARRRNERIAAAVASACAVPLPNVPIWRWFTDDEAARLARCAPRTWRYRRSAWQIPFVRDGKKALIHPEVFDRAMGAYLQILGEDAEKGTAAAVAA